MPQAEQPQDSLPQAPVVFTIGHGSRAAEEFLDILHGAGIACLVDVRSYPVSRRHPAYSRALLSPRLEEAGIAYRWLGTALGGFRKPSPQSPHRALRSAALRGYAEHMTGGLFLEGIGELLFHARQRPTAILCAERLPQDCHRALIADYLVAQDIPVVHLLDIERLVPHRLSPLARRQAGQLIYDHGGGEQLGLAF